MRISQFKKVTLLRTLRIAAVFFLPSFGYSQSGGSLTPPGAPSKTMKSLDQIEPRTPLVAGATGVTVGSSGTTVISLSGSYYLTENLTVTGGNGIVINASGVTLDLMGFTIRSTASSASWSGVDVNGSNVSVFNGHIESGVTWSGQSFSDGPGFDYGIYASSPDYENIRIRDINVGGVGLFGIFAQSLSAVVVSCTVTVCGSKGITAGIVENCSVQTTGNTGITADTVNGCRVVSVGSNGIIASTVMNCHAETSSTLTDGHGILAVYTVMNSYGSSVGGSGIRSGGAVSNSYGVSTGTGDGINAGGSVVSSYGTSTGNNGITSSGMVSDSRGSTSGTGDGIEASRAVSNSYGFADATAAYGIICATGNVSNSYGLSFGANDGIFARNVTNSYGQSEFSDGIDASGTASYSYGVSAGTDSGDAGVECTIAIGCTHSGGISATHTYLQP